MRIRINILITFIFTLLFSGCGGSGGSGGGDSGPHLSLETTSIEFNGVDGEAAPVNQFLSAKVDNLNQVVYVGISYTTNVLDYVHYALGTDTIELEIQPKLPAVLGAGDYTDEIIIFVCKDEDCYDHIAGSPATVTINYSVTSDMVVSHDSLDYAYDFGSNTLPAEQSLTISGTESAWSVIADQAWVELGAEMGTGPGNVSVGVNPDGLDPGAYSAAITVTETDTGRIFSMTITFEIAPPVLAFDVESLGFAGINGAPIDSSGATLTMNNAQPVDWNATASVDWIVLGSATGTAPSTLTISVDPSVSQLASGSHVGTVTVTGSFDGVSVSDTLSVTLDLTMAELTVDQSTITLGGDYGLDFSSSAVTISLNTGANTYPWSAELDSTGNWLVTDMSSGSSVDGETVTLDADRSQMMQGVHSGSFDVTVQVNGDTLMASVPVTLNLSAHMLVPSDVGLAFTKTPFISVLGATLSVSDTYGLTDTPWSASSDQTWLSVSGSGTTSDTLTVTAEPAGLAIDSIHYATVTLTSANVAIENSPKIEVALWNGASDPAVVTSGVSYSHVQSDPVRPFAYLHNGGDSITVINVYTGGVVATWSSIGTSLGEMTISDDGGDLYAVDTSNARVAVVSLETGAVKSTTLVGANTPHLAYLRPAGHPILVTGDGQSYGALSGDSLGALGSTDSRILAASADGKNVCALNSGRSPWSLTCHALAYSSMGNGAVIATASKSISGGAIDSVGSNGKDVALNIDGSRVYIASGAPYSFAVLDGTDLSYLYSRAGGAYPNNVETTSDGKLVGAVSSWYGPHDFWVYDEAGVELAKEYVSGYANNIQDRQVHISGDGQRVIVLTDDPLMKVMTLP